MLRVANFFGITLPPTGPEVIVFRSSHLRAALKTEASEKAAFYFNFGCITLVNFDPTEAYRFVNVIEATGENIDYRQFFSHVEKEEFQLGEGASWEETFEKIGIRSATLAKSVELKYLEDAVSQLYDKAERILNDLQSGFPNLSSQLLMETTFGMLRFQLGIIKNLRILDRPKNFGDSLVLRSEYEMASKDHRLEKRFSAIQLKLNDLMSFISPYRKLGYSRKERRLLLAEVALLVLFPLALFIKEFIHL